MKADRIGALAGDDLYGLNGPDTYRGGDGEDSLSEYANAGGPAPPAGDGYTGKDVMYGEGGSDHLEGARGDDTLYGGPNSPDNPDPSDPTPESPEFLDGNTGDDTLKGGGAATTWKAIREETGCSAGRTPTSSTRSARRRLAPRTWWTAGAAPTRPLPTTTTQ
jgi:Ca2+-binding RTX toxin-like protein